MFQLPVFEQPKFLIIDLVNDFHISDHTSKQNRANLLAFRLIEVYYNNRSIQKMDNFQLSEQQVGNFIDLIGLMVFQESELNNQIKNLSEFLGFGDHNMNFSNDTDYFRFRESFYSYFSNKEHKIFSSTYDQNALYSFYNNVCYLKQDIYNNSICQNTLYFHPEFDNKTKFAKTFYYIKYLQISRLMAISITLSKYFCKISNCGCNVLEKYDKNLGAHCWLSFVDLIQKETLEKLYGIDDIGVFWFHVAIHYNDEKLLFKWLSLGASILNLELNYQKKALELVIYRDNVQLFRSLIYNGLNPSMVDLEKTYGAIKKLLDYKPGKNKKSIRQFLACQDMNMNMLKLMTQDEEDTSDEESSDDEIDTFQPVNPISYANKRFLFRGVNYSPQYFKSQKRREAKQHFFHKHSVYSNATQDLARKMPCKENGSLDFERADQLIKSYFELLKLTSDKPELNEKYKKITRQLKGEEGNFENLY